MRKILKFAWILLSLYILFCLFIALNQQKLMFFPSKQIYALPNYNNLQEISIKTNDWLKLDWYYLENKSDINILFFHWNWWNLTFNQAYIELFNELWFNALFFDYRWYWKSEWDIKKEDDLYIDADSAYNYLKQKWIKEENMIFWWHSLWNALSINLAQDKNLRLVVVESAFYSMDYMARLTYPYIPTNILLKYHFRNDEKIKNIKSPIIVIHSKNDEVINYSNWTKLYNEANNPKYFLQTETSHNYWFPKNKEIYKKTLKDYLRVWK